MENNIGQKDRTVEALETRVQMIKDEVDTLQSSIMRQQTSWYKNISTIIAAIALLFSFGTTYVSYNRTMSQDMLNLNAELRGILPRIVQLTKEDIELTDKYANNPEVSGYLKAYNLQINNLLARQAASIAKLLPKDRVTATEYYSIAIALEKASEHERAREFYEFAKNSSNNYDDESASLRSSANHLFAIGRPEEGRIEYQKALKLFTKYQGVNDLTKKQLFFWTEFGWASSEYQYGSVDEAYQHIVSAERYTSLPNPTLENFKKVIEQKRKALNPLKNQTIPPSGQR